MMFACSLYPSHDAFLAEVSQELAYQIARLREHPSVALWCGDNEVIGAIGWYDESRQNKVKYTVNYDRLNRHIEKNHSRHRSASPEPSGQVPPATVNLILATLGTTTIKATCIFGMCGIPANRLRLIKALTRVFARNLVFSLGLLWRRSNALCQWRIGTSLRPPLKCTKRTQGGIASLPRCSRVTSVSQPVLNRCSISAKCNSQWQ